MCIRVSHRSTEEPVPESDKDKMCVWKRAVPGEDALSGQWKYHKKMDAEIPWMGSGIESADRVVRGTADTAFIKGKSQGGHVQTRATLTNTLFRRH